MGVKSNVLLVLVVCLSLLVSGAEFFNHDFENGDLTGWIVFKGPETFYITNKTMYPGGPFYQQGFHHLRTTDEGTGILRSPSFVLEGSIDFLIGGSCEPEKLWIALVRESDGEILLKASPEGFEDYFRHKWETTSYIGQRCYILIVDETTTGHINIDDVNVVGSEYETLINYRVLHGSVMWNTPGTAEIYLLEPAKEDVKVAYIIEGENVDQVFANPKGEITIEKGAQSQKLEIKLKAEAGYVSGDYRFKLVGRERVTIATEYIPLRVWNDPGEVIPNHDFETGDLTGWIVVEGDAFSDGDVTNAVDWGWGGPFEQHGQYHLWGFREGGDGQTGILRSQTFVLKSKGEINLLIGGGSDINNLYVALLSAEDNKVIFKETGLNDEAYRRIYWEIPDEYVGEPLYIEIVDKATGGWGHINIDDVNVVF